MSSAQDTSEYIGLADINKPTDQQLRSNLGAELRQTNARMHRTLPNLTGAMTRTHTQLNFVDVSSSLTSLLAGKVPVAGGTMTGNLVINNDSGNAQFTARPPNNTFASALVAQDGSGNDRIQVVADNANDRAYINILDAAGGVRCTLMVDSTGKLAVSPFAEMTLSTDPTTGDGVMNRDYADTRYAAESGNATQAWVNAQGFLTEIADNSITGAKMGYIDSIFTFVPQIFYPSGIGGSSTPGYYDTSNVPSKGEYEITAITNGSAYLWSSGAQIKKPLIVGGRVSVTSTGDRFASDASCNISVVRVL